MAEYGYKDISKSIDHALLHPTLTTAQLEQGIRLAIAYDVASVCIMPHYHKRCADKLAGTTVLPSSTVGFPHGTQTLTTKLTEADQLIDEGCMELDILCNMTSVLSGSWREVEEELEALVGVTHAAGRKIKVILENCYLKDSHKVLMCKICCEYGVDWVKTSTGFGPSGATLEDLELMLKHVIPPVQVKAAGGVQDLGMLFQILEMGVTRIGTSRTAEILDDARRSLGMSPIVIESDSSVGNY